MTLNTDKRMSTWMSKRLFSLLVSGVLAALFGAMPTQAAETTDALVRPAVTTTLGPRAFMLGAANAGERLVVAGERGIILLSDDNGHSWKQAPVPVSVTLTTVRFADPLNGFAIGHGGTVLTTRDGGESWTVRLDGNAAAKVIHDAAQVSGDERAIASAERLVYDGPDKPMLDMALISAEQAIVVGAYGIALSTDDGGQSWHSLVDRLDNPGDLHIYTLRRHGDRIVMAGEMGMVWLSVDGGQHYDLLETPYEGSFFTAELMGDETIILAGLRGNVWRSDDNGEDWTQVKSPVGATITASMQDDDGQLLMVNQAGMVMALKGDRLVPVTKRHFPPLNNLLEKDNGDLLIVSARGLMSVQSGDLK
ncbi:WD40/YVTN/BNR-like repeat-containing protein [Amphritea sp.]|uniref:WD40/YVTN/BNR-like repeat-containing protein n=1 Tax=Amphritea sp. TaxID=1872502 RepID=UPI003A9287BB